MSSDYMNIEQVADRLQVSTKTIRNFMKQGLLTGFKAGRDWRFTDNDLKNLEEKLRKRTQEGTEKQQEVSKDKK
jgi:excisionase family DNA binding protein